MIPPNSPLPVRQIVGAAVVDSLARPTSLLAARRTAPEQFAGMWEFPGGKVEDGEGCIEALQRELAEELGISVEVGVEIEGPEDTGWPLHATASMRVWAVEVSAGDPAPLQDHDALQWVSLSEATALLGLPWIPADRPIVDALLKWASRIDPQRSFGR
ncbi:(deoxy)nucleoside triphosphate pyrophosphohydrolase [Arthrobacter sp. H41]|uniref:(deoxy)nucleoside triphosphate pyrophosphohydrolase n=1 Tax=Arthrobacter sp. H41 TaxID=1312978 RepID=UPI0004BAF5A7|nr:NUDIX domain-containing protein [Arthrobacter sp. H41]